MLMIGSDDIRVFVLLLFKDSPWYQWKDTQRLQRTHTVKYNPHTHINQHVEYQKT